MIHPTDLPVPLGGAGRPQGSHQQATDERWHYSVVMENAELRFLVQEVDFQSPFPFGDEGFRDDWWHSNVDRVGDDTLGGTDYVQLLLDGIETGRASLTDWQLSDSYIGIDADVPTKEIWFFEIRSTARCRGLGAEFASLLREHYASTPLIAFSEGADEFWESIGWIYYPRKDGDIHYRKLFISERIPS